MGKIEMKDIKKKSAASGGVNPCQKGAYLLLVKISKDTKIEIGALSKLFFEKGTYVYVGSAMNGIEKRVKRHFGKRKKIFWHIDYLLSAPGVKLGAALAKPSKLREECKIANKIALEGIPVLGFGCSDCNCNSHLFKVDGTSAVTNLKGFRKVKFHRKKQISK